MRRYLVSLLAVWACIGLVHAQEISPEIRDLIEQRVEAIAGQLGEDSDVDLSAIGEQLMDRLNDPLDLNHATAQDLADLYMLSDIQVNAIIDHIQRFGKFISIYELQTIDALDL
ncbi:MAG: helix-hairpin-helix domain-containing protein, partial [Flavobacteriales bacterium]|nr:helix-hairpin-helix domain-containing protein [Flavobacteriales bacterium]